MMRQLAPKQLQRFGVFLLGGVTAEADFTSDLAEGVWISGVVEVSALQDVLLRFRKHGNAAMQLMGKIPALLNQAGLGW